MLDARSLSSALAGGSLVLASLAAAAAAVGGGCGDAELPPLDDLPASFRIQAEIESVTGSAAADCTPNEALAGRPDWELVFDRVQDPSEPTFREWTTSSDGDSADRCALDGDPDCCAALVDVDGGGWLLECDGTDDDPVARNKFVFTFAANGSGTANTTRTSKADGLPVCTSVTAWPKVIPL